jgi:protein-disulfide isomerase
MTRIVTLIALGLAVLAPAASATAQTAADIAALRADVEALQAELRGIKTVLRERLTNAPPAAAAPAAAPDVSLPLRPGPVKGDASARLVLVEFTDYECPFCARHQRDTLPRLEAEYVKTGKLRYAVREFPLEAIHPRARAAAEAALCAGDQGRYWEMHARLFAHPRALAADDLSRHAEALGLDGAAFGRCLADGTKTARVRRDLADGAAAGVAGTPAFFLGVEEGGALKVVRVLRGAQPYEAFKQAIDAALAAGPGAAHMHHVHK